MNDAQIIALGTLAGAVIGSLIGSFAMGWADYTSCQETPKQNYSVQVQDGIKYHTYLKGE